MRKHHIRHLPVLDEGGILHGVLSIRDLIREEVKEMRAYIAQREG
jgi:CBS domain-containing protein